MITTGGIIGIIGIIATAAVGITIYYKQRRADHRINELTKELHRIVHQEDERKKSNKEYVLRRINADFDRFDYHYKDLKQHIQQYLEDKSEKTRVSLERYVKFFLTMVDSFITVVNEIKSIEDLLDNPRLKDKYDLIPYFGGQLKVYAMELAESPERDSADILDIEKVLDSAMSPIYDYKELLKQEVDNKLDQNTMNNVK
jgi:hypothetical protein